MRGWDAQARLDGQDGGGAHPCKVPIDLLKLLQHFTCFPLTRDERNIINRTTLLPTTVQPLGTNKAGVRRKFLDTMLACWWVFHAIFYIFFSDLYLLSPVCHCWALLCGRSHPCLPDWRCLRCSQGVSWLKYISSPFLFAIECFFSYKVYVLYSNFIAGTPVTSASKAWSGLRPTLRTRSWSQSTSSILSRTSAWVSWDPTVIQLYPMC